MYGKSALGLRIIGTLKLVSAALLCALGFGIFHLLGSDIGMTLDHYVRVLHLDPERRVITEAIANASGISKGEMKALDVVTFLYALLYIVEGVGLLLGKHWAEYLTIIATASLIPVEIYEIVHKTSGMRIAVLLINVAIVAYLIFQLRRDRKTK